MIRSKEYFGLSEVGFCPVVMARTGAQNGDSDKSELKGGLLRSDMKQTTKLNTNCEDDTLSTMQQRTETEDKSMRFRTTRLCALSCRGRGELNAKLS